jgi:hypothetical protein
MDSAKINAVASQPEMSQPSSVHDVEKAGDYAHLTNVTVQSFAWENVTVTVKDRSSGKLKTILNDCFGIVKAGKFKTQSWCYIRSL